MNMLKMAVPKFKLLS